MGHVTFVTDRVMCCKLVAPLVSRGPFVGLNKY